MNRLKVLTVVEVEKNYSGTFSRRLVLYHLTGEHFFSLLFRSVNVLEQSNLQKNHTHKKNPGGVRKEGK